MHRERRARARKVLLDLLRRLRGLPRQREERGVVVRYPHLGVHDARPHVPSEGTVGVPVVPLRRAHRRLGIAALVLHGDWSAPIRVVRSEPDAVEGARSLCYQASFEPVKQYPV